MTHTHPGTPLLFALAVSMSHYSQAHSDALQFGAAVSCDVATQTFTLSSVVEHNYETTIVAGSFGGFRQLNIGSNDITCKLGETSVLATVIVLPPSNGECGGVGEVRLSRLAVGSTNLTREGEQERFSWRCHLDTFPIRIDIRRNASELQVTQCTADEWSWDGGYKNIQCKIINNYHLDGTEIR